MKKKNIKILVTLGPSSLNKDFLKFCAVENVSLLRLNMSHIEPLNLYKTVNFIRKYNSKTPICIDTEGAQIRTKVGKKIKQGEINFDKLICTPNMMIKLSKLGKVLGPKGLMPNPKLGTVNENVEKAIKDAKSGQVEIRNDKDGNIGLTIGKKSFSDENLIKNYNAVIDTLEKEKSNYTVKGNLIKSSFITSSMGVSYKLKLTKSI